jgi:hypothetical protein
MELRTRAALVLGRGRDAEHQGIATTRPSSSFPIPVSPSSMTFENICAPQARFSEVGDQGAVKRQIPAPQFAA